jgi:hypothetical protein
MEKFDENVRLTPRFTFVGNTVIMTANKGEQFLLSPLEKGIFLQMKTYKWRKRYISSFINHHLYLIFIKKTASPP